MIRDLIYIILTFTSLTSFCQEIYSLKKSSVHIFAGTPVEDIEATNIKSTSFLNLSTGEVILNIPIKDFKFRRALMEEHFNENYMETEKYAKSEFKGKILDLDKYDFKSNDPLNVKVQGLLIVHGISKERIIEVALQTINDVIEVKSNFTINLEEHHIERPRILWEKIAENVDVKVKLYYEKFKK